MRRIRQLLIVSCGCLAAAAAAAQDNQDNADDAEANAAERAARAPAVPGSALDAAARRKRPEEPAIDELDLGRTEITGNQELPKVLYIVPWQKSDPGNLLGRPVNSLLDEVLAPLDREEFIRQVDYYSDLNEPQDE